MMMPTYTELLVSLHDLYVEVAKQSRIEAERPLLKEAMQKAEELLLLAHNVSKS